MCCVSSRKGKSPFFLLFNYVGWHHSESRLITINNGNSYIHGKQYEKCNEGNTNVFCGHTPRKLAHTHTRTIGNAINEMRKMQNLVKIISVKKISVKKWGNIVASFALQQQHSNCFMKFFRGFFCLRCDCLFP